MREFEINNAVLVNFDFTIWTGRAKLDETDIPEAASKMPPKELCSAGSIKIFDTDLLKPFRNFKTRADILAAAVGFKVFGGWLVDAVALPNLENDLASVHANWHNALQDFIQTYPANADAWAKSCGQWESLIRQKQPGEYEIGNRFHFGWQTVRLMPETTSQASGNETAGMIQALPDKALQSIIDDLKELYDNSFNKSGNPTSKAYGALRRIAERARALGFANPDAARLEPVLLVLADQQNHALAKFVLSRMDTPQDVVNILAVNEVDGGIEDLFLSSQQSEPVVQPEPEPEPIVQPEPEPETVVPQIDLDSLLAQAKSVLTTTNAEAAENKAYNDRLRDDYEDGIVTQSELIEHTKPEAAPEPEPVRQQPMDSMDVLDSLGLF